MVKQIRTILVPTDFSDPSLKAIQYATTIAGEAACKIIIFHAVSLHLSATVEEPQFYIAGELEKIENEQLVHLKYQLQKRHPAIQFECISRTGFPVESIKEIASEVDVDLIVMGTRGASGIKGILVGSNTSSLIEHTQVPVLAVPEETEYSGIRRIVFATNMQKDDIRCLKSIIEMFSSQKPSITLLHIEDGHQRDPEAALTNWFREEVIPAIDYPNLQAESISETDIVRALDEYLRSNKIDLLVTATKKRNFIERIFDRSITKKLVFHSSIPLLALQANQSKGEIIL